MARTPAVADPEPPECPRCHQLHYRSGKVTCTGHRSNGLPCLKYPIRGGHVCERHGGAATQVRAAANDRLEHQRSMAKMTAALVSAGITPDEVDPTSDMLWAVATSAQAVRWLAAQISELHVPELEGSEELRDVVGVDDEGNPTYVQARAMLYGPNRMGDLTTHPLWREWNAERERHMKFCKAAIDVGVTERMVRIAEAEGEMVVDVILYAFDRLGLDQDIKARAKGIVAARFRELSSGPLGLPAPT